jgi:hypothetical protein
VDVFKDRLDSSLKSLNENFGDKASQRIQVAPERQFVGFDSYKQVVDSGVDVVVLTSYPNFRPAHIKYALEKGKHIFAEKPMAVDMTGLRDVYAAGEEAKRRNLAMCIGFCWVPPRDARGLRADRRRRHRRRDERVHQLSRGTAAATAASGELERHGVPAAQLVALHLDQRGSHRRAGGAQRGPAELGDGRQGPQADRVSGRKAGADGRRERERVRPLLRDLRV